MAVELVAHLFQIGLPRDEILDQLAAALSDIAKDAHQLVRLVGVRLRFLLLVQLRDPLSSTSPGELPTREKRRLSALAAWTEPVRPTPSRKSARPCI